MENSRKQELSQLRDEIRRLAEEGRSYNPRVSAARGPERHALRQEKAAVGRTARTALLAYAMLRGAPYRALERVCREDSSPYERSVLAHAVASSAGADTDAVLAWMGPVEVEAAA